MTTPSRQAMTRRQWFGIIAVIAALIVVNTLAFSISQAKAGFRTNTDAANKHVEDSILEAPEE